MKYIIILCALVWAVGASALTLEEIAKDPTLKIKSSKGPKYRKELEQHALSEWEEVEDLGNLVDDGLIHSVYEGACDPDVYQVDEVEVTMDDWPSMHVVFNSIKKGSTSIAYVAHPVVVYTPTYHVYKTHADYKRGVITKMTIDCGVQSEIGFYYEHNKENELRYLGHAYDLSEFVEQEPEYGILVNGSLIQNEKVALALYEEFKSAEETDVDVNVCYFGGWEQAVESAHRIISIGVLDIYVAGELEVEVHNTEDGDYTYGLIRQCG